MCIKTSLSTLLHKLKGINKKVIPFKRIHEAYPAPTRASSPAIDRNALNLSWQRGQY